MKKFIVLGASAAGIAACSKLRFLDQNAEIVCISKESEPPYNRCLLADYLGGSKNADQVYTKGTDFFEANNIKLLLNSSATKIDRLLKKIHLSTGETYSYDALLIATGRSAFTPPLFNSSMRGLFPFYDLAHATTIRAYIEENTVKNPVVIGGGITGLECADALLQQNLAPTLIEQAGQLLPRQLDQGGAAFLAQLAINRGITVHNNTTVNNITEIPDNQIKLSLSGGSEIISNLVIIATGGRQNSEFALAAGITCDQFGIVTDEYQATNDPLVFAAGDVCSVKNLVSGERCSSSLWPDAVAQGISAAHSMVGLSKPYAGALTITSTTIFGITLVTCGSFPVNNSSEILSKHDDTFYHKFYLQEGILQTFVMIGNVSGVGQLRKAIIEKTKIT